MALHLLFPDNAKRIAMMLWEGYKASSFFAIFPHTHQTPYRGMQSSSDSTHQTRLHSLPSCCFCP
jgi:hypothetical protein